MDQAERIQEFCRQSLASMLDVDVSDIAPDSTFASLGLDSATAVHFVLSVEQETGLEFEPGVTADYPSLQAFATHIARLIGEKG